MKNNKLLAVGLTAAILLVAASAFATLAPVSASRFLAAIGQGPYTGQSNGLFVDKVNGGLVLLERSDVTQRLNRSLHVGVFEDFIGKAFDATSKWGTQDTSAAGTPTLALKDDSDNGAFEMAFDNTNEAQKITLYWNDNQVIDSDQKPVITFRMQLEADLNANDSLVFGLASARNATLDNITYNAWFKLDGSNVLRLESDDNSTDTDDKLPGVTLTNSTYYEFKEDASNIANILFYYRTTQNSEWTPLTVSGTTFKTGADQALQPYIELQKSSGTQTTGILWDYIDVSWIRNAVN